MAGIEEPRNFASQADLDFIVDGYWKLGLRPGAAECVDETAQRWVYRMGIHRSRH